MSTLGGRLRSAMTAANITQRVVAAHFKVTEQAVSQWARDATDPETAKIFELAKLLGVRAEWLLHGTEPREVATVQDSDHIRTKLTTPELNIQSWPRDVPILGGGACGEDGMFELNGQTHDHARRPPRLIGVKGVFALYVYGSSMSPWREPGGLVYVHPSQPVKIGDHVLVELYPELAGNAPPAYIKKLVRRTAENLVLCQYGPAEEKTFKTKKVKSVLRIMEWDELMS